jgi:hypothetical protein
VNRPPESRPEWHTLLAPLPAGAIPRQPTDEEAAMLKRLVAGIVMRAEWPGEE